VFSVKTKIYSVFANAILLVMVAGCASRAVPSNLSDLCQIFRDKPHWYKAAKASSQKWGAPIHLPMAIMYQESSFKADAKPPMKYFLGLIPTGRPSDAYGYSQALKSTWAEYQRAVGSRYKNRDNFASANDFVQWYVDTTHKRNGVSKWDAYGQYLNYHEGQGGYARGTHKSKTWLLGVANKVNARSKQYSTQLSRCQAELDENAKGWF
jgi:hypothetical protein